MNPDRITRAVSAAELTVDWLMTAPCAVLFE